MHLLLTGASGLAGQGVLQRCLAAPDVDRITLLVRRPSGVHDPRVRDLVLPDFARAQSLANALGDIDAALYCAGAPPVGTREAEYRQVTVELTLAVARAYAQANPGGHFLYISGAGANPGARLMPFRVKGEIERALQNLPITTTMLRPGGILPGTGTSSPHAALRLLHTLARPLHPLVLRCLPASMTTNFRLGDAMLALARQPAPPPVVENTEINRLGAAP